MKLFSLPKLKTTGAKVPSVNVPSVKVPAINLNKLVDDFKTLDMRDPGLWPLGPRIIILFGIFLVLLVLSWFLGWSPQMEELEGKRQREQQLKTEWLDKKKQAVNLDAYRKQKVEIDRAFGELLRQLPNRAEMDAMIVDVSQAALTRGLKIDLFKPGGEVRKDFYAEMPISVQMVGAYGDMGQFAGDLARLPRVVTLNNVKLKPKDARAGGSLSMEAVVMTYRYLDSDEMAAMRKQQKPGGAK